MATPESRPWKRFIRRAKLAKRKQQAAVHGLFVWFLKAKKIMSQMHLSTIQPHSIRPRTTHSQHCLGHSPNLLIDGVEITRCNKVWTGDITYIGSVKRFAYMAVLMDLYSRKIVGWSIELEIKHTLLIATLKQAIAARQKHELLRSKAL